MPICYIWCGGLQIFSEQEIKIKLANCIQINDGSFLPYFVPVVWPIQKASTRENESDACRKSARITELRSIIAPTDCFNS